jgi:leucyl aminopeptidase
MALDVRAVGPGEAGSDLVAVGLAACAGPDGPELVVGTDPGAAGLEEPPAPAALRRPGFAAKAGQVLMLRPAAGGPDVIVVGLGAPEGLDHERWRKAAAALVRATNGPGSAALVLPDPLPGGEPAAVATAVAEGAVLASYRFDDYKSAPRPGVVDGLLVVDPAGGGSGSVAAGIARGARTAAAVAFARDLINTPAGDLSPSQLADRLSTSLSATAAVTVEVWDEQRIAAERLGGLLGVSQGSAEPPRLVRADYEPADPVAVDGAVPHVVLVGKGITFDSGGLSLKTAEGMSTMKTDMSGAAIVMAALSACADLGVRVKVSAIAPLAENMPGGKALRPGDVLTMRNGATVEVLNTDAEGRLVLADALSLAAEIEPRPTAVVDLATLTGAAAVALGTGIAPIYGTDDDLVERVRAAGAAVGERLWPMPLPEDYGEHIDSEVADMKNTGRAGQAGSIAAALLLERFTGGLPWAHLDIAGTGRAAETSGYLSKGGTAFGVRTLLAFLASYG